MQPTNGTSVTARRAFVDTQGWAEMFYAGALRHAQAEALLQEAQRNHWTLITSNLVLSELAPLLRSRNFHLPQSQILAVVSNIRTLPNLAIIHIDPLLDQQAWDLLQAKYNIPGRTLMRPV